MKMNPMVMMMALLMVVSLVFAYQSKLPKELLRLKLVGVGKILTGIYVLLFGKLISKQH